MLDYSNKMPQCEDVYIPKFYNEDDTKNIETKLKELFDEKVNRYPVGSANRRPVQPNQRSSKDDSEINIARDALWFAVPINTGSEQYVPFYRIPGSNNFVDPLNKDSKQGLEDFKMPELIVAGGEYDWLAKILDKLNREFELEDQFKFNHMVIHQFFGEREKETGVNTLNGKPDRFAEHHDKIVDLHLHSVNKILDGKDKLDDQTKKSKPKIISLSFGHPRTFTLSPDVDISTRDQIPYYVPREEYVDFYNRTHNYTVRRGDLICMSEELNLYMKHGVQVGEGTRYSITVRTVHTYAQIVDGQAKRVCPYYNFLSEARLDQHCWSSNYAMPHKFAHRFFFAQHLQYPNKSMLLLDSNGSGTQFIMDHADVATKFTAVSFPLVPLY